jgi:PleD family two-component response regulator
MLENQKRNPLVLIASDGEWFARSLESVLELNGYGVRRTAGGSQAIDAVHEVRPDAILLDDAHSDMSTLGLCRALRDDPLFDHSTPIVITSSAPSAHRVRTDAFAAGAWDYCGQPLDIEALLLKLSTFIRARRELAMAQSLTDPVTGLYSPLGLEQWAKKLGAMALRKHESLACVAVTSAMGANDATDASEVAEDDDTMNEALNRLADVCHAQSRRSDVVGYLGQSRFAILAPDTDAPGAQKLIARLREALAVSGSKQPGSFLRAGYCAITNFASAAINPADMMRRAEAALQYAEVSGHEDRTFSFDELPAV